MAVELAPSPHPDIEALEPERAAVRELAAHVFSGTCELALEVARLDASGAWAGDGYRSVSHWLSINLGLGRVSAQELVRVGHALEELPAVGEAFAHGSLSYDKVRFLTQVATPADEDVWVELALTLSGSQLIKLCKSYQQAQAASSTGEREAQLARRGLWSFKEDGGMVKLIALLPPEDAAVVMSAIEAVSAEPPVRVEDDSPVPDPAEDRWAARRGDSLVAICKQAMADGSGRLIGDPEACQLVVHVDLGVLTGGNEDGRCHLEDGTPIAVSVAQRLGCSAGVVAITEKDGLPIDVGRSKRFFTRSQQRALRSRDQGCLFPGCGWPAARTTPHHIIPWYLGGPTDLENGASLCDWHHRRLHDGQFRIERQKDGKLRFMTADGQPLEAPVLRVDRDRGGAAYLRQKAQEMGYQIDGQTPMALDAGHPPDFGLMLEMLVHNRQLQNTRAGPS